MIDTQQCLSRYPIDSIDLDKWQKTANLLSRLYGANCATIVQLRQNEFNTVIASQNEGNFMHRDKSWSLSTRSFCRKIIEAKQGLYVKDAINNDNWKSLTCVSNGSIRSYLGLPLLWPDGSFFGTICVIDTKATNYKSLQVELFKQLRDLINADLKIAFTDHEIKNLELTDQLTGLHNRRGLSLLGDQLIKDAKRIEWGFGFIYFNIDNMKTLNDTYGHAAGDKCISALAEALKVACRENDIIARIGGDEFVVLLTCKSDQMKEICTRIESTYHRLQNKDNLLVDNRLSYSHTYHSGLHPVSLDQMIEEADKLMQQKKHRRKTGTFEDEFPVD